MNDELNREIAYSVILPKLQQLVREDKDNQITTVASMRGKFNTTFEQSISASKFQEWIDLLDIKFQRKTMIVWPAPGRPSGPPLAAPTNLEVEEETDDSMSHTFPPQIERNNLDAFGQC